MKTKIISVTNKDSVGVAINVLKKGGIIIYPTETSYGMGADYTNPKAVKKIYRVKGRDERKKLSVMVSSISMAKKYASLNREAERLVKKYMPGPLTLVVRKRNSEHTIAFRIPAHDFALRLAKKLRRPVTATSANISGKGPLYGIRDVLRVFNGKVDMIVDAGNMRKREPSTIYDTVAKKNLREGPVKVIP